MADIITIDGSQGEGGGQILRTSLAFSAALGREIRVTKIRAGRPRPGLRAQHMAAVEAAAAVCGAEVVGVRLGSQEITFRPGEVLAGRYRFDIGTAGSTVLVLQTIIPALMLADGDSDVTVTGGTHNPFSPCFEYLRDVFGLLGSAANLQAYFELVRAGFYPAGGGKVRMQIRGVGSIANVAPIRLLDRGDLKYVEGVSAASRTLAGRVLDRQSTQVLGRLAAAGHSATAEQAVWDTDSPGTAVFLRTVFTRSVAGVSALGRRGLPAEEVADHAVDALLAFLDAPGVLDPHAADQLLTLAGLCRQESRFSTTRITDHLLTNAAVVRQLTGRQVIIDGRTGQPGTIAVGEQ